MNTYLADEDSELQKEWYRSQFDHANRYHAFFRYDAENAYGTAIRGVLDCTYDSVSESIDPLDVTVKLDGKTLTEKLVDRFRQDAQ